MSFEDLIETARQYFPHLQIKYKDQSTFMKILGKLLFFKKGFMSSYATTIGSTIYFPTESFVKNKPASAAVVLMHELVHLNDSNKWSRFLFSFLCITPFVLYFEKRAYLSSLYVINSLSKKLNFPPLLDAQKHIFENQFRYSFYHAIWDLKHIDDDFDQAVIKIKAGERPYEDPIFDTLDNLITSV